MIKFYMMIGLPASGKSTIAREIAEKENAVVISTDKLRKELLNDENSQADNNLIFKEAEKRLKENINNGNNVIFDATNINYKKRRDWLNRFNKYNVEKIAILVATPYEECLERNAKRKRKVPEEVITRMYYNFYIPQYYEGFDDIQIKYNSDYLFFFDDLEDISQDNPYHTLTVLNHCKKVEEILQEHNKHLSIPINFAGRLHDIGKLKTKTFTNKRGETTDVAHFYDHEKVSAYDSLFYINLRSRVEMRKDMEFVLETLNLIQWHMVLHFDLVEKTIKKYKNLLGEEVWKNLEVLHKADCEGR